MLGAVDPVTNTFTYTGTFVTPIIAFESIDKATPGTFTIGASVATKLELADTGVITEIQGILDVIDTTTSTTTTTGALTVAGGVGIGSERPVWMHRGINLLLYGCRGPRRS